MMANRIANGFVCTVLVRIICPLGKYDQRWL